MMASFIHSGPSGTVRRRGALSPIQVGCQGHVRGDLPGPPPLMGRERSPDQPHLKGREQEDRVHGRNAPTTTQRSGEDPGLAADEARGSDCPRSGGAAAWVPHTLDANVFLELPPRGAWIQLAWDNGPCILFPGGDGIQAEATRPQIPNPGRAWMQIVLA